MGTGTVALEGASGRSRMAQMVEGFDWASTPLGPMAGWPVELRTTVSFILESRFPAAIVWGPQLVTIYNDAFRPILGSKPEALGRSFADIWREAWDKIGPIASSAFAGEATFIEDFPLTINRSGGPEAAWFTFCYSPIRLADGSVGGMMDTVVETTSTVRNRVELDVLNNELRHRLKNTLSTVQAITRASLKDVEDRTVVRALLDRIVAMGSAHDVLFREGWTTTTLAQVARTTLAAHLDRIDISGPDAPVGARATVALSLLLHELATNAVKYGALSNAEGRVALSWEQDEAAGLVRIRWRETGGPTVSPPQRTGFGSRLLDMGLSPRGQVRRRYEASGFEADIEAPLSDLTEV